MPIQVQKQIVTTSSPVIGGGVPPSGNLPVHSPFTGGFKPRIPISQGPVPAFGAPATFSKVPTISSTIFHPKNTR